MANKKANKNYGNTFNAVKRQIGVFDEMLEVLAANLDKLTAEEKEELEGYIDNQKRQCELFVKLEPAPAPEKPKPEPKKKTEKPKPDPEPVAEEDDFEDLLG